MCLGTALELLHLFCMGLRHAGQFFSWKKNRLRAAGDLVNPCFSSPPPLPAAVVVIHGRGSLDLKAEKTLTLSCGRSSLCSHLPDVPESAALYCHDTKS